MKVKTTFRMKVPKLSTQDDLLYVAERIIIPEVVRGIDRGTDIEGNDFPELEANTIRRKGHNRQLIDRGELRRSFIFRKRGKNAVVVTLNSKRKEIGEILQFIGIRSKHGRKFFNFFGITDIMEAKAMRYMRNQIEKAVQLAR